MQRKFGDNAHPTLEQSASMRTTPARRRAPATNAVATTLLVFGCLAVNGGCKAEAPAPAVPLTRALPGPAAAARLIVCTRLDDAEQTRLLLGLAADGHRVTRFEIVTPDFLWRIPGQPESRRFAAGESDASPDLAGRLRFTALTDGEGELRALDFAAPAPDAVQLEGLRGSLALHEPWQNDRALGSLFHAATGNLVDVAPVQCRRFEQPHAPTTR